MEVFPIAATGVTLGFLHAFDLDHVVAVTVFLGRNPTPRRATSFGLWWGLGHTATLAVVGYISSVLQSALSPTFQQGTEIAVGVLLVFIGLWSMMDFVRRARIHVHKHTHDGVTHLHFHSHQNSEEHFHHHHHMLFLIGIGHGLAGSASVLAIVPVTFLASTTWTLVYVLSFGFGTIIAMATFALLTGRFLNTMRMRTFFPKFRGAAGVFSIGLGSYWIAINTLF